MTEVEIKDWLRSLADTTKGQQAIVKDLLKNANSDGMVDADRIICRWALTHIGGTA